MYYDILFFPINSAVAVSVLESAIRVGDNKWHSSLLQEMILRQESLLESIKSEVVLSILEVTSHPVISWSVILTPGVGGAYNQDTFGRQHLLEKIIKNFVSVFLHTFDCLIHSRGV